MALVQYSDSESDIEEEGPPRKINKLQHKPQTGNRQVASASLPPLPAGFHDLYASNSRVSIRDDPSLHGGRKRATPHVEGNWPTHIYLEWYPSKKELEILGSIITQTEGILGGNKNEIHSFLHSDLGAQLPLHISLSRPVVLRTEQRQQFMDTLQTALRNSNVPAFDVQTESLDCVPNFEKTRWFYVLRVRKPDKDHLNSLLRISNRSLGFFGQPPLYEAASDPTITDPSNRRAQDTQQPPKDYTEYFHISIAWSLTEPSAKDRKLIERIDLRRLNELQIRFDCVKAKIGNQVSSMAFSS